jgi:hypothetical protein
LQADILLAFSPLLQVSNARVVRLVCFLLLPRHLRNLPPRSIRRRPLVAQLLLCFGDLVMCGGF